MRLRQACSSTRSIRATLDCPHASRIPPNLSSLRICDLALVEPVKAMPYLKSLTLHGKYHLSISVLQAAISAAPLEHIIVTVLLFPAKDVGVFVKSLLEKPLQTLKLDEYVPDDVVALIGRTHLRDLAISMNGEAAAIKEMAKCRTLRKLRLEVPERRYQDVDFLPLSELPLEVMELNGCSSTAYVQPALKKASTFFYEGEINLTKFRKGLKTLEVWGESVKGDIDTLTTLEWLVIMCPFEIKVKLPNLIVLQVGDLFSFDVEDIAKHSPNIEVWSFSLRLIGPSDLVATLVALSNLSRLQYLGIETPNQIRLQGAMNVCHHLKLLLLDGEQVVREEIRQRAKLRNIIFDNAYSLLDYARPKHDMF